MRRHPLLQHVGGNHIQQPVCLACKQRGKEPSKSYISNRAAHKIIRDKSCQCN
jgi:hypothetical protein